MQDRPDEEKPVADEPVDEPVEKPVEDDADRVPGESRDIS